MQRDFRHIEIIGIRSRPSPGELGIVLAGQSLVGELPDIYITGEVIGKV